MNMSGSKSRTVITKAIGIISLLLIALIALDFYRPASYHSKAIAGAPSGIEGTWECESDMGRLTFSANHAFTRMNTGDPTGRGPMERANLTFIGEYALKGSILTVRHKRTILQFRPNDLAFAAQMAATAKKATRISHDEVELPSNAVTVFQTTVNPGSMTLKLTDAFKDDGSRRPIPENPSTEKCRRR